MTPVATSAPPGAGAVLGERYEIRREIGRGGYSIVYEAHDRVSENAVAIKWLFVPPAGADLARARMEREVHAVRRIEHPYIVAVLDYLTEGAESFVVMECVDGGDLAERLLTEGPLPVTDVIEMAEHVAGALAAAHDQAILHRDVKPQNILLSAQGAKLTDFGSARMEGYTVTRTGGLAGTIQYTAPEVLAGRAADPRADLYALGVTMYFALTGELPEGATAHSPPTPSARGYRPTARREDVPRWVDDLVANLTAADPETRTPSAELLVEIIRGHGANTLGPPDALHHCVICGSLEPFGLPVCAACGGTTPTVADTFVFVEPPPSRADRDQAKTALAQLLAGHAHPGDVDAAAHGYRAVLALPASSVDAVQSALRKKEVPTRATPAGKTWVQLPLRWYGAVFGAVGLGLVAGLVAQPLLLLTSPLVGLALILAGQARARQPLVQPSHRRSRLPDDLLDRLVRSLGELPHGAARRLLADLVRTAIAAHRMVRPPEPLEDLLRVACDAAHDLANIEAVLTGDPATPDERHDELERARDAAVARFLDAQAMVTRMRTDSIAAIDARARMDTLIRDMELHLAAQREVEVLLR